MRMFKRALRLVVALITMTVLVSSCSDFKKLQKGTDLNAKYEAAVKYYEKGDYLKAQILLEELIPLYRGQGRAEDLLFYYAQTTFELGDYTLAQYHFKTFARTYPQSPRAEECLYMSAYCYYLNSPAYSLDQTDTYKAIQEFQLFIDHYPQSARMEDANRIIDTMREKLERKAYETAKLYYQTGDYRAAVVSFNIVLKEFPGTKYKEEIHYLIIRSNYLLAVNSIEGKKEERLNSAIESYRKFIGLFPEGSYRKQADSVHQSIQKLKEKIQNNKTS
jgi:outer membrane protein assembly factor BamD